VSQFKHLTNSIHNYWEKCWG